MFKAIEDGVYLIVTEEDCKHFLETVEKEYPEIRWCGLDTKPTETLGAWHIYRERTCVTVDLEINKLYLSNELNYIYTDFYPTHYTQILREKSK